MIARVKNFQQHGGKSGKGKAENGTGYFSGGFLGRPRGRNVDSKSSAVAQIRESQA
jgi:hypothetical protein